ncbi:Dynamin GTPase domain [Pyrenophora seminiperda CCB06]|uniref:Dynamin GTPase domain n=1 Tax=Pyrenophora seminiperda CCB06 TaxID=1302712 RepID=A0A3M7M0B6_9PLEO|nr:Dynamin GTPase domain [Pyrenophora seminiperda CCB06]
MQFPAYIQVRRSVPKYDSSTEQKPDHAWWRLDKPAIDALLKGFSQLIVDLLQGSPTSDKELQHLFRTATDLSHVTRSAPISVALLGAQGAGKSLNINAIFDCDGLSLTGAEGAACTSSVTKYVQYPKSNTGNDKFFAEIKFFTRDKRTELLAEHARSYYFYHNADDESDNEDTPRVKCLGQDEMDRSLNDTAEDIFTTIFGSRDDFLEHWSVADYKSGEFIRLCQFKCDEALAAEGVDKQDIVPKMADSQKGLLEKLRPFLTSVKGQRCLWPLVDHISVRFYHDLLQGGIEIIDLPGWGDINLSRVQHAEKIKNTVDVEIILADTIRIASDDKVINNTRAAIAHHGPSKVKVIATKIDSLTKNQLSQCSGGEYDRINEMLQDVEEREVGLDDDDDDDESSKKRRLFEQYRTYLERCRKQRKILQRADHISTELKSKLQVRSTKDMPQIYHTSASEYMDWIRKPKLGFAVQPSLSPEMTGIPAIRAFLYSLPAQQNLRDYENHIKTVIPAFVEKVKRTVTENDRDGGFRTIADDLDSLRRNFMKRLLSQVKSAFRDASSNSTARIQNDIPTFKEQLEERLAEDWLLLKAGAFNRMVKGRGVVPKGASKAKGLEHGRHWTKEIAEMLTPGLTKWFNTYRTRMVIIDPALHQALNDLHRKTITCINDSSANMVTIEKAKKKWNTVLTRLQTKLAVMMDSVKKAEKLMYERATMEFGQEHNLIADVTGELYATIFEAVPEEKPAVPGKNGKMPAKRYVMSKLKFQKKVMEHLFLDPDNHLVDQILTQLQEEFNEDISQLLDTHFTGMEKMLEEMSENLRAEAPIDYRITREGEELRTELAAYIPALEEKACQLRSMLPMIEKQEEGEETLFVSCDDSDDMDTTDQSLSHIMERIEKKKRMETPANAAKYTPKRIKMEPA